jgi:hypothetical protein
MAGLVVISLALGAASNLAHAQGVFTFRADPKILNRSLAATVRIFETESGGGQIGSGFVIDGGEGLILTAAHVVAGLQDKAWIAFTGENIRHRAKIVASKSINSGASPFDLAILKFDPKIDDVDSLEVQFEPIISEDDHEVTGYGRSNSQPQPATVKLSPSSQCMYTLRGETLYGDSGSAVLTAEGLVDGIAVDGAESGGGDSMSEMKVLPLSCVMSQILEIVPDGQSAKIMATITKGSDAAMRHAFQPPPKTGWISNLRLAKAVQGWIAKGNGPSQLIEADRVTTAITIIAQRRLGYKMAMEFSRVTLASAKDAGDTLRKFADMELRRGSTLTAEKAYAEAGNLFLQYAKAYVPLSGDVSVPKHSETATTYATAFKAIADTLVAGALISGKKEDLEKAKSFAAGAVLASPKGKLKASSWATLGSVSQEAGEASVAVPAFRAAIGEGASASWITQSLVKANSALGQSPQTDLSAEYLSMQARQANEMVLMQQF